MQKRESQSFGSSWACPALPRGTAAPLLALCLLQAPLWAGGSPVPGAFCGSGGQELKSAGARQSRAAQGPNGWLQGCHHVLLCLPAQILRACFELLHSGLASALAHVPFYVRAEHGAYLGVSRAGPPVITRCHRRTPGCQGLSPCSCVDVKHRDPVGAAVPCSGCLM